MGESRKIMKCHASGTATGKITIRQHLATVDFMTFDGPYMPDCDAIAYSATDPTIQCKIFRTRNDTWYGVDVTENFPTEWVKNPKSADGMFKSIPELVGYWQWEGKATGCWFAYER